MNKIHVQQTGGFPLESDTLTFMQESWNIFNQLGAMAGEKVILSGCIESGGNVSPGFVVYNNEVLPFEGGALASLVRVVSVTEEREFEDGASKAVYETRKMVFGNPGIAWSSFKRVKSLMELTSTIDSMNSKLTPVGAIIMWAGAINEIPTGWKLCDGTNGTPDLRSRFVVGYNSSEADYNAVGKVGGAKDVTLTEAQMPSHGHTTELAGGHQHAYADSYHIENAASISGPRVPGTVVENLGGSYVGSEGADQDNNRILYRNRMTQSGGQHSHIVKTSGGGQAHENRPPYYTLAFIQFKGL